MWQVSQATAQYIESDCRTFKAALHFESGEKLNTDIISAEVSFDIPEEDIRPGMVLTSSARITAADDIGDVQGKHFLLYIKPITAFPTEEPTYGDLAAYTHAELHDYTYGEIGEVTGGTILMGRYKVTSQKLSGDKTTIDAHDDFYGADRKFTTGRTFPCQSRYIEQDICNVLGIRGINHSFNITLSAAPEECTYREMLGIIAALDGGKHAMLDRNGYLIHKDMTDVSYTVSKSRSEEPEAERKVITVTGLCCKRDDDPTHDLVSGTATRMITFSNPYMTVSIFNRIASKYVGLSYKPLSAKYILGDPRLEPLDEVTVQGKDASWFVPLTSLTYSFDGGLSCNLVAGGKTDAESEASDGPMTRYFKKLVADTTSASAERLKEAMQNAVNYIMDPITTGVGGYHFQAYNADGKLEADYWTDNEDINQATNIIMINRNGMAGTNTGLNGVWKTAITNDGRINASMILTGVLSAILIQSLNYDETNHTGSMINLDDGTFSFAGGRMTWNGTTFAIEGKVTVSDSDSKAILSDAKLKLQRDNKDMGFIGTQTDQHGKRGIVFDLEFEGDYMSWGAKDNESATTYSQKFTYYRSSAGNNTAGFNMLAQLNMHNYDIVNADLVDCEVDADFTIHDGNTANIYRDIDMHNYDLMNVDIVNSSDRRLKKNITDSEVNATDVLKAIKPREFDWKEDNKHEELGFIADELGAVKEKFATTMSDGTQGIKLLELVPYLVKSFKELEERVSRLERNSEARAQKA